MLQLSDQSYVMLVEDGQLTSKPSTPLFGLERQPGYILKLNLGLKIDPCFFVLPGTRARPPRPAAIVISVAAVAC